MSNYEQEIWRVLTEAGSEGLSVQKISRHVFNACNSFFAAANYDEIHRYAAQFLLRNSKNPGSPVEKTDRGIYRLNLDSHETRQLMLQFREEPADEEPPRPVEDRSLSLF